MKYTVLMSVLFLSGCSGVEIVGGLVLMGIQEAADKMYEVDYSTTAGQSTTYTHSGYTKPGQASGYDDPNRASEVKLDEPVLKPRPEDEFCNSGLEDCSGEVDKPRLTMNEPEESKREVVLDPVVENPQPPSNEPGAEMLSAPVMVNPSSNSVAPLRQAEIEDTGVAVAAAASVGATSGSGQVNAERAPLQQSKPEDPGVAIAAVASAGAAGGPKQVTAEGTSSKQKSQPDYLRVAILPFAAKFPARNSQAQADLERFSKEFLGRRHGLNVTYSYYQPELGRGPHLNPAAIWKGNLNKLPKKSEIYTVADKLDADLALAFSHAPRTADSYASDLYMVDVYVFDLTYERMYHAKGDERNYKEIAERLFEQLIRDREDSARKGT